MRERIRKVWREQGRYEGGIRRIGRNKRIGTEEGVGCRGSGGGNGRWNRLEGQKSQKGALNEHLNVCP